MRSSAALGSNPWDPSQKWPKKHKPLHKISNKLKNFWFTRRDVRSFSILTTGAPSKASPSRDYIWFSTHSTHWNPTPKAYPVSPSTSSKIPKSWALDSSWELLHPQHNTSYFSYPNLFCNPTRPLSPRLSQMLKHNIFPGLWVALLFLMRIRLLTQKKKYSLASSHHQTPTLAFQNIRIYSYRLLQYESETLQPMQWFNLFCKVFLCNLNEGLYWCGELYIELWSVWCIWDDLKLKL